MLRMTKHLGRIKQEKRLTGHHVPTSPDQIENIAAISLQCREHAAAQLAATYWCAQPDCRGKLRTNQ